MKQKKTVILGVDPGTRISGYGIIQEEEGSYRPLDYGCIRPPTDFKLSDRYLIIFNGICELIQRYRVDAISVETQFVAKNAQSAMKLGMARCAVMIAGRNAKVPIFEYAPMKAKLAVVGNGKASKEQVQAMVQRLLNLHQLPDPPDIADALALAICHAHTPGIHQKEV